MQPVAVGQPGQQVAFGVGVFGDQHGVGAFGVSSGSTVLAKSKISGLD